MDPNIVTIRLCNSTKNEINSIKLLQNENLKCNLSENDISQEGFVTAIYDHDFLHLMNSVEPSIVAVHNYDDVDEPVVVGMIFLILGHPSILSLTYSFDAGYSLVITRETISQGNHQLLADLFCNIDAIKDGNDEIRRLRTHSLTYSPIRFTRLFLCL